MDRCFRLARSVDLQRTANGSEGPIDGPTSGLMGLGDHVTWKRSLFFGSSDYQTSISALRPHSYFREVMVAGPFTSYEHDRHFAPLNDGTRIREEIRFVAPYGWLGRIAVRFFLRKRIVRLLGRQSAMVKQVAESEEWHTYLDGQPDFDLRPQPVITAVPSAQTLSEQNRRQQVG